MGLMRRIRFSLFDLFQQLGGLRPSATGRGVYRVDAPPLTIEVRADASVDAFQPDFFTRVHCPADIRSASGGDDAPSASEARP